MKKQYIVPIFIPHLGCPNDCIFCNQKYISGEKNISKDIIAEVKNYVSFFPAKAEKIELAFYGGSFTGLSRDEMLFYLNQGKTLIKDGIINSMRLSTRPDYISKDILQLLDSFNVTTIELGIQSMDKDVLNYNKRFCSPEESIRAINLIKKYNFNLGLQMMTGMYGSNPTKDLNTGKIISSFEPDFVRIYPTMVLPHTDLYRLYLNGMYDLMNLEDLIILLKDLVTIFESKNIPIIRLGLHSSGEKFKEDLMLGPKHPALRQLVYSRLYFDMIVSKISLLKGTACFYASNSTINYLSGYKSENRIKFEKFYDSKINFITGDFEDHQVKIVNKTNDYILNFKDYLKERREEFEIKKN